VVRSRRTWRTMLRTLRTSSVISMFPLLCRSAPHRVAAIRGDDFPHGLLPGVTTSTSPSAHAGPWSRGGKHRTPSVMLGALSPVGCAPARTPLGTTRLPVGLPPRLPKGPEFAPTTPTRTRRRPTWPGLLRCLHRAADADPGLTIGATLVGWRAGGVIGRDQPLNGNAGRVAPRGHRVARSLRFAARILL
jgi:hypothetical protein